MNKQWIIVGIATVVGVLITIAVVAPDIFGEDNPFIPDALEPRWYAEVRVVVSQWSWNKPEIESVTLVRKSALSTMTIGPLFITEYKGKVVFEAIKDGVVVGRDEKEFHIGRLETATTVIGTVLLGKTGSGTYTIRVTEYGKDGKVWGQDTATRTI